MSEQDSTKPEEELTPAEKRKRDFFQGCRERAGYEHDWYIAKRASKKPLVFATTGGEIVGRLGHFRVYEFDVKVRRIKEPLIVQKLNTFTINLLQDQRFLGKHIKTHKPTQDKKLEPQEGAGYNPPMTEGLVESAIAEQKLLAIMLLNDSIIIGHPIQESLYSVLLKVPDSNGREVLIYKHGMAGAKLFEDIGQS